MSDDVTSPCAECGASVYKEHIDSGIARYEDGRLLCSHCIEEMKEKDEAMFAPIEFDDGDQETSLEEAEDMSGSRIHSATQSMLGAEAAWDESKFNRPLRPDKPGATRFRVFHCRLSKGAIDFMNDQINEWLDTNPDVVIKFTNSVVGPFEGKHTEPNLILTVFY